MLTSPVRCVVVLLTLASHTSAAEPGGGFETHVAPLLKAKCLSCHAGARAKGGLNLASAAGLKEGGASGPVVEPGKAAASLLYRYVADRKMPPREPLTAAEVAIFRRWIEAGALWEGPDLARPAAGSDEKRADASWWSLQPLRRPPLPAVKDAGWVRTPIDAFVLAGLERAGLTPNAEADRRTYLRRVSLDLTGLLPTPEEVEAFVRDQSAEAYEKQVERLLASPRYGERWGRHWLDVVRFAESHGYEMNTLRPNAWPYRDYVIAAFNEDRPFPRFVLEQLAGDAVAGGDPRIEAATGFLVGGTHDMVGNATPEGKAQQRSDDLYDMVSTTGSAFLGLTLNCARCHDHKFDPILQKDYYGLEAVFAGVQHAERPWQTSVPEQQRREAEQLRAELAQLAPREEAEPPLAEPPGSPPRRPPVNPRRNVERFRPVEARFIRFEITATSDGTEPCLDELEALTAAADNVALAQAGAKATASSEYAGNPKHRIAHLNDGKLGNSFSWISRERGKGWVQLELPRPATLERIVWGRDREQAYADRLPSAYRIAVSLDGQAWQPVAGSWDRLPYGAAPAGNDTGAVRRKELETRLKALEKPAMVYAGTFQQPGPTHLLRRGDPTQKLEAVLPSAVRVLGMPLQLEAQTPEQQRRVALAEWIADIRNPLPARVMVNRLWHYHFGQGIVRTPSDFGFNGDRPSHPELLDWLATEYQTNGWRLKPLHRLIVLSAAYRQSALIPTASTGKQPREVDAGCRLLWRFPARRLEAEAIRDCLLQVSGSLNERLGGPGYHLWDYSGYVIAFKPKAQLGANEFRRMVYQFKPRTQQDPTFGAFDCPDATQTQPRRTASTTALQALNLLHGEFVFDQAERFAARLTREAGSEPTRQVARGFALAFGRPPTATEAAAAERLVRAHGLPLFCRALFNANEFVFAP